MAEQDISIRIRANVTELEGLNRLLDTLRQRLTNLDHEQATLSRLARARVEQIRAYRAEVAQQQAQAQQQAAGDGFRAWSQRFPPPGGAGGSSTATGGSGGSRSYGGGGTGGLPVPVPGPLPGPGGGAWSGG